VLLYLPALNELTATGQVASVLMVKRAAGTKFAAPLVDLTPDLQPQGKTLYLDADSVHFTTQGNAIVAERLFETFTNILTK
jgi:lysophospholipase L1-like esterase